MDVKPKAEPFADDCVVALSGAYCSEGTDPQSDQAADPTPIMLCEFATLFNTINVNILDKRNSISSSSNTEVNEMFHLLPDE